MPKSWQVDTWGGEKCGGGSLPAEEAGMGRKSRVAGNVKRRRDECEQLLGNARFGNELPLEDLWQVLMCVSDVFSFSSPLQEISSRDFQYISKLLESDLYLFRMQQHAEAGLTALPFYSGSTKLQG